MSEEPGIRYKIRAKLGEAELEVVALHKPHVEEIFDKYKEEILGLK